MMHYALTLYLLYSSPAVGTVVPATTGPVFATVEDCLAIGNAYSAGTIPPTQFTCTGVKTDEASR